MFFGMISSALDEKGICPSQGTADGSWGHPLENRWDVGSAAFLSPLGAALTWRGWSTGK